jgi:hypothetical protein
MIAVAVLAVLFWAAVAWIRYERSDYFRRKADLHASIAAIWQNTTKAGAIADYHDAMRCNYEQAASNGRFYVEPDPPEPTSP